MPTLRENISLLMKIFSHQEKEVRQTKDIIRELKLCVQQQEQGFNFIFFLRIVTLVNLAVCESLKNSMGRH